MSLDHLSYLYHSVLLRMKLINFQQPPSSSSQDPPSSQAPPSSTSCPSRSTHFDDVYYNTLTAEVMDLKTKQASMFESQASLLSNRSFSHGAF